MIYPYPNIDRAQIAVRSAGRPGCEEIGLTPNARSLRPTKAAQNKPCFALATKGLSMCCQSPQMLQALQAVGKLLASCWQAGMK